MTNDLIKVIAGVDTHADTHHVALISQHGTHLADEKFVATGSGYRAIVGYITQFGPVIAVGIEGTGSYGAGLARVLAGEGFEIVEVNRTNRQSRRLRGKSYPLDATKPPSPCWSDEAHLHQKRETDMSRLCGSCGRQEQARSRPGLQY